MTSKKRVVITGMGIVSSIGNNLEEVKNSLINQKSGIVKSDTYKEMGFRSQIHGEVKFTGQILPIAKKVEYLLDFKRIIMRKLILGIADGKVICDDKLVFEASDIRVGLFQD